MSLSQAHPRSRRPPRTLTRTQATHTHQSPHHALPCHAGKPGRVTAARGRTASPPADSGLWNCTSKQKGNVGVAVAFRNKNQCSQTPWGEKYIYTYTHTQIYIYIYSRALSKSWLVVENIRDYPILFNTTHGLCPQHPPGVRKPLDQPASEPQSLLGTGVHTHTCTHAHTCTHM